MCCQILVANELIWTVGPGQQDPESRTRMPGPGAPARLIGLHTRGAWSGNYALPDTGAS